MIKIGESRQSLQNVSCLRERSVWYKEIAAPKEGKACPGQGKRRFETGMNARILHIMRQRICGSEHGCRFMW